MKIFKEDSIKLRITMWYALFIMLIIAFMVCALLISQHLSSQDYYEDLLAATISDTAASIQKLEDAINLTEDTDRGVHITVLGENGEMLYGRRTFNVPIKKETMRIRRAQAGNFWYIMDMPVQLEEGNRIWLRGYISSEVSERYNLTITIFLLIAVPILLLIAVFGGLLLTKRAFRPLDVIIRTAEGISASTDLKQRFRLENQEDEVGRLADTFDGMLGRLERSLEDEKSFMSDVSHELRTPISVIRAQSEFALSPGRTLEEKDAALETILQRSTRAGQMISQMLLLSRMDFNRILLNIERIDLSELLRQIAQEMAFTAEKRNIHVEFCIEDGVFYNCDELMMIRMVTNLMENAVQYGRDGGYVRLELARCDGGIEIVVEDDGIGISETDMEKIWQRFYQVNKSGNTTSGSGLGLAIVKWISNAHGGNVDVKSALGKGSRFTVRLPAGQAVTP